MFRYLLAFAVAVLPGVVRAENESAAEPALTPEMKRAAELLRLDAALQTACGRCNARVFLPSEVANLTGVKMLCLRQRDVAPTKSGSPRTEAVTMLVASGRCLDGDAEKQLLDLVGRDVKDLPDPVLIEVAHVVWAIRRGAAELLEWSDDPAYNVALAELIGDVSESRLLAIDRARNPYASIPYVGCDIMREPDLAADNASETLERCPVAAPRVTSSGKTRRVTFSCVLQQECYRVYNVVATFEGGELDIRMTNTECQASPHGLVPATICVKQ